MPDSLLPLQRLKVSNFQSLRDVDLTFGRLSIFVGHSSSGKSALVRAIRTLVCNHRGTSFISHSSDQTVLKARTPYGMVELYRGRVNQYVISDGSSDQTFTKLAGDVPYQVSKALGIKAPASIQLAGQFDSPYLVTSTGSEVSRELGALTYVDIFLRAAKEANRRRLQTSSEVTLRKSDLEKAQKELSELPDVSADLETLETISGLVEETKGLQESLSRLLGYQEGIARAVDLLKLPDYSVQKSYLREINDLIAETDQLLIQEKSLTQNHATLLKYLGEVNAKAQERHDNGNLLEKLDREISECLASLDVCTSCGQVINHES